MNEQIFKLFVDLAPLLQTLSADDALKASCPLWHFSKVSVVSDSSWGFPCVSNGGTRPFTHSSFRWAQPFRPEITQVVGPQLALELPQLPLFLFLHEERYISEVNFQNSIFRASFFFWVTLPIRVLAAQRTEAEGNATYSTTERGWEMRLLGFRQGLRILAS